MSATVYSFGEWLPDLNDLGNPGVIEALNVLPIEDGYEPYLPLVNFGATLGAAATTTAFPTGGFIAEYNGIAQAFASLNIGGGASELYASPGGIGSWTLRSGAVSAGPFDFTQYDNLVITTGGGAPLAYTFGATTNFTTLATSGTAPSAQHVGVINKFVVIGNMPASTGANALQWSGFDAPRSWPTPNSATAVAQQAGAESIDASLGEITGITNGDQFGIVLQQFGLTRLTYAGPPVVFQFDQYERGRGNYFPYSKVQVGSLVYYVSDTGFCVTDGVSVIDIGAGKVNRTFLADLASSALVNPGRLKLYGAADLRKKLIYWCYPNASAPGGVPNRMFAYNYERKRWTHMAQQVYVIFSGQSTIVSAGAILETQPPYGFDTSRRLSAFLATAGAATITTTEIELSPGDYGHVDGVKPLVTGTSPAMTVAVGTRTDQGAAATFTAERTATARTGFCDFRSSARYHRARLTITGPFSKAVGVEVRAIGEGED
jgi:hypothetical protein